MGLFVALGLSSIAASAGGCSSSSDSASPASSITTPITDPRLDEIFLGATPDQVKAFNKGDGLFDLPFFPGDGLGPLYVNVSCGECHNNGLRGPGSDSRMVMVEADGFTTAADQSPIAWGNELRGRMTAGAKTPVLPPNMPNVKVTIRNPPPIIGHGYMEAINDSEIVRMETEQATRTDGIHGKVNYVAYASDTSADPAFNPWTKGQKVIGRFGLKARVPTLDDFTADAFQNDMGITSPLRPNEPPNPDNLTDDMKAGVDTTLDTIGGIAMYMRLTAIPLRGELTNQGKALFEQTKCNVCHAPSLRTRADYPIPQLADIDAPVYTDMLIHDMGSALADGMIDGQATSTQYRTAPLIGMRYMKAYLHDGRAHDLDAAIREHGGESSGSAQAYGALSSDDKKTLLAFVVAL